MQAPAAAGIPIQQQAFETAIPAATSMFTPVAVTSISATGVVPAQAPAAPLGSPAPAVPALVMQQPPLGAQQQAQQPLGAPLSPRRIIPSIQSPLVAAAGEAFNKMPSYSGLSVQDYEASTARLSQKISPPVVRQYGDTLAGWTDGVVTGNFSYISERSIIRENAWSHLYPGAFISSTFRWEGFTGGAIIIVMNDWEIRSFLKPYMLLLRMGQGQHFFVKFGSGTSAEFKLSFSTEVGRFVVDYGAAGTVEFHNQGNQAVFDWLWHLVQYFDQ